MGKNVSKMLGSEKDANQVGGIAVCIILSAIWMSDCQLLVCQL